MAAIDVFADLTNRKLVASSKGVSAKPFANPFHQDKLYLDVQPLVVNPAGSQTLTPYETLDGAAFSLSVLVTKEDGTTLAGPTTSWTPEGTAKRGSIDLNTAAMATAFTSGSTLTVPAYIFFQFDDGANHKATIQQSFTIKRSYITSGTPSELPATSYLTREECLALFVKFSGNPNGSTITLPSPSGAYKVVLTANDDGSGGANIET